MIKYIIYETEDLCGNFLFDDKLYSNAQWNFRLLIFSVLCSKSECCVTSINNVKLKTLSQRQQHFKNFYVERNGRLNH